MYEQLHSFHFGQGALRDPSELAQTDNAGTDLLLCAAAVASVLETSLNQNYKAAYMYTERAMELFPQAVPLSSIRVEQLRLVRKYHHLPSDKMALAVAADVQPSRILEHLEQSRAFIWDISEGLAENI